MTHRGNAIVWFCVALFSVAGLFLVHEMPSLWHAKFYLDGQGLLSASPSAELFAGSYRGTAWIFSPVFQLAEYLGLDLSAYSSRFDGQWFAMNLLWTMPYLIMIWIVVWQAGVLSDLSSLFVMFCALVLYAPFYGSINKDIVPTFMSFTAVVALLARRHRMAVLLLIVLSLAYGLVVRQYFLIFLAVLLVALFTIDSRRKVVASMVAGAAIVYFSFPYIPRALIDIGRAEYLEDVSNTRISYFFGDYSALGFTINRVSAMFRLAFPLELLLKSPVYAPFVLFRCYATLLMIKAMAQSGGVRIAACCVFAFTITQAIFEPDFGSAFRHFMMAMPLLIYLQAHQRRIV